MRQQSLRNFNCKFNCKREISHRKVFIKNVLQLRLLKINIFLGIASVVGNMLVLLVIHLKMKRNNANLIMKLIATAYATMMFFLLLITITFHVLKFDAKTTTALALYLPYNFARCISEWLLVYVTSARSLALLWPKKVQVIWSNATVYGSVLIVVSSGLILQVPIALVLLQSTSAGAHSLIYQMVYHLCILGVLPMTLLLISSVVMVLKSKSLDVTQPQGSTASSFEQMKTINKLLIVMAPLLAVCHIPVLINSFIIYNVKNNGNLTSLTCVGKFLNVISYGAIGVNAACQLPIYTTLSVEFRKGLKNLFTK